MNQFAASSLNVDPPNGTSFAKTDSKSAQITPSEESRSQTTLSSGMQETAVSATPPGLLPSANLLPTQPSNPIASTVQVPTLPTNLLTSIVSGVKLPSNPLHNAISVPTIPSNPLTNFLSGVNLPSNPVLNAGSVPTIPSNPLANFLSGVNLLSNPLLNAGSVPTIPSNPLTNILSGVNLPSNQLPNAGSVPSAPPDPLTNISSVPALPTNLSSNIDLIPGLPSPELRSLISSLLLIIRQLLQIYLNSYLHKLIVIGVVLLDVLKSLAGLSVNLDHVNYPDSIVISSLRKAFEFLGLVFSHVFVVELIISIWTFGFKKYLLNPGHVVDGIVIVINYGVSLLLQGALEQYASLVVLIRLWRIFAKVRPAKVDPASLPLLHGPPV